LSDLFGTYFVIVRIKQTALALSTTFCIAMRNIPASETYIAHKLSQRNCLASACAPFASIPMLLALLPYLLTSTLCNDRNKAVMMHEIYPERRQILRDKEVTLGAMRRTAKRGQLRTAALSFRLSDTTSTLTFLPSSVNQSANWALRASNDEARSRLVCTV
jgi:hypothetical protein